MSDPAPFNAINLVKVETALNLANQNMSQLIQALNARLMGQSPKLSSLSVLYSTAGGTTVKVGNGFLISVAVTVASTGTSSQAGVIYDANSPANVSSTCVMTLLPSSGNAVYGYPFVNGLTISPSSRSSQAVSVYYV